MYDKQEIFAKAVEAYNHAEDTITRIDSVFRSISGSDYDPESTLAQFDILLQGVLVSVACSDMIFDDIELQFIKNIAVHGDLFDYIRADSDGEVDLTWEVFTEAETKGQLSLVSILPQVLADQCESFVLPLAAVDFSYSRFGNLPTTPGDFLRSIESDMITIATLLASLMTRENPSRSMLPQR